MQYMHLAHTLPIPNLSSRPELLFFSQTDSRRSRPESECVKRLRASERARTGRLRHQPSIFLFEGSDWRTCPTNSNQEPRLALSGDGQVPRKATEVT